ncbi:MAG TPA: VOC family protein [Stenomitos sp.]
MVIDHIHFYVEDVVSQRDRFIKKLAFQSVGCIKDSQTHTEILKSGSVYFVLSSPLSTASPVFKYLQAHPAGVVDVALKLDECSSLPIHLISNGQEIYDQNCADGIIQWTKVRGWGSISHTIIVNTSSTPFCESLLKRSPSLNPARSNLSSSFGECAPTITPDLATVEGIDHVVLNVPSGELAHAVQWYTHLFNFQAEQSFNIRTQHSGLNSKVLVSSDKSVYFNINEPTSENSQIQEFLNLNNGSGIQHIALRTSNLIKLVKRFRKLGQSFLNVPNTYYDQLKTRIQHECLNLLTKSEFQALQEQHILMDWNPCRSASLLLQIFTQPIFNTPTFFLS